VRRPTSTVCIVTVVVVLRLLAEALAEGELVGHAELVRSGHRSVIRNAGDLMTLLADDLKSPLAIPEENPT